MGPNWVQGPKAFPISSHLTHDKLLFLLGRSGRARTYDPRFWRPVLYQLSYTPTGPKRLGTGPKRFPLIRAVSSIGDALFARAKRPNALFKPPLMRQTSSRPTAKIPDSKNKWERP
jgi:hypothetical protein